MCVRGLVACGVDAIVEVPAARWDVVSQHSSLPVLIACRVRHGGFVSGAELADNVAFGTSAAETATMDPQQRLVLEHGYGTLHDAHLGRAALGGSLTGVFVGVVPDSVVAVVAVEVSVAAVSAGAAVEVSGASVFAGAALVVCTGAAEVTVLCCRACAASQHATPR